MFLSYSIAADRFTLGGGSLGIYADGQIGPFSYLVGVWNGIDTDVAANPNNELAYSGRFTYNVLNSPSSGQTDFKYTEKPGLAVGVSGGYGHYDTGTQARVIVGSGDVQFKYKGYSLWLAGFWRQIDPDQFTQAQQDVAFSAYTGYFVIPKKLEIGVRASALFDDINESGLNIDYVTTNATRLGGNLSGGDVNGDADNEWEYTAGVNWYIKDTNIKFQTQYTLYVDGIPGPDDLVNHVFMAQIHLNF
ncbi:MAG: hypothetical protein H7A33_06185 [Deltaproteobacteria bacterium]|nr:hypothetical protein [Deltaproteobacteria bacterium]